MVSGPDQMALNRVMPTVATTSSVNALPRMYCASLASIPINDRMMRCTGFCGRVRRASNAARIVSTVGTCSGPTASIT